MIRVLRRAAVLGLGIALLLLVGSAWSSRSERRVRLLAGLAVAAYLAQAGIGAMVVLSREAPVWGAGHVLFAALTWAALVCLSVIETVNSRVQTENQWQQKSTPILNS